MPNRLITILGDYLKTAQFQHIWIAYSGGLDSQVLLHAMSQVLPSSEFTAIHVNHQLSSNASDWVSHCVAETDALGIKLIVETVKPVSQGKGLEADARDLRYQAFRKHVGHSDILLTSHHLDDQIETFFLRLFRGAGIDGLASMPRERLLNPGLLARPFLSLTKSDLLEYAQANDLVWVEDESNADDKYDRNMVRNQLLPLIEARWPSYRQSVERAVDHLNAAQNTQLELLSEPLSQVITEQKSVRIQCLESYSQQIQYQLIRAWIKSLNFNVPSQKQLVTLFDDVIFAKSDSQPELRLSSYSIRRFNNELFIVLPRCKPELKPLELSSGDSISVAGVGRISLILDPDPIQEIVETEIHEFAAESKNKLKGVFLDSVYKNVQIRFDPPEGKLLPVGRNRSRDLKRLLQEYRVKPWLRGCIPFIYSNKKLIAVGDIFVIEGHQRQANKPGIQVKWLPECEAFIDQNS